MRRIAEPAAMAGRGRAYGAGAPGSPARSYDAAAAHGQSYGSGVAYDSAVASPPPAAVASSASPAASPPLPGVAALRAQLRAAGERVRELARATMPTRYGTFTARLFDTAVDGGQHLALTRGRLDGPEPVLVRAHSECHTGDAFGSLRCDCGAQLAAALAEIGQAAAGVLIYQLGHEGRGIGLVDKLRAYGWQDRGLDTVDANLRLGLPVDRRDFRAVPLLLRALGVRQVALLTDNPDKLAAVRRGGYPDVRRRALPVPTHPDSARYLATKRTRLGHLTGVSCPEPAMAEAR